MNKFIQLFIAFLKKNILNQSGYKLFLFFLIFGSLIEIIIYFITNKFIDNLAFMEKTFGMDYFTYIIIGYAIADLFTSCTLGASNIISRERTFGTSEHFILSPWSLYLLLFVGTLTDQVKTFGRISIFIAISIFMGFNINLHLNLLYIFPYLVFSTLIFLSFSMFFSAFVLCDFRFTHLTGIFISISTVLSGAFYPTNFLPKSIEKLVHYMPFAFVVQNLRELFSEKSNPLLILIYMFITSIILLIISYLFFNGFKNFSKKRGTILKY